MCGLKGMESGMAECFGPIAEKNGIVWTEFAKAMKKAWPCSMGILMGPILAPSTSNMKMHENTSNGCWKMMLAIGNGKDCRVFSDSFKIFTRVD